MMRNVVTLFFIIPLFIASSVLADSNKLNDGDVLLSHNSSTDTVNYKTTKLEVHIQRKDSDGPDGSRYALQYKDEKRNNFLFQFDATPHVELFEIVDVELTKKFCNREFGVATLREYTNIEEPQYLYTRIFLDLSHQGSGYAYLDSSASKMGGPTPLGLIEKYADIYCGENKVEVSDK